MMLNFTNISDVNHQVCSLVHSTYRKQIKNVSKLWANKGSRPLWGAVSWQALQKHLQGKMFGSCTEILRCVQIVHSFTHSLYSVHYSEHLLGDKDRQVFVHFRHEGDVMLHCYRIMHWIFRARALEMHGLQCPPEGAALRCKALLFS